MASVAGERLVEAPPDTVFEAFTRSAVLHMWLCDYATVVPRQGGRMHLGWHGGYHSAGEFLEVDAPRSLAFTWRGPDDAAADRVTVTLEAVPGVRAADGAAAPTRTLVRLEHELADPDAGCGRTEGLRTRWAEGLEDLAFVLETGADRRAMKRPMLGIAIGEFGPEIARAEGIPVDDGIRLDSVVPGMGAEAAGLRAGDVVVEIAGRAITSDFSTFAAAIHGTKAGDRIDVAYYRGPERRTTTIELSGRPAVAFSWDPRELARALRERYDAAIATLEAAFADVPDDVAARRSAPDEWSAHDVLAHLVLTERAWLGTVDDIVTGYERVADGWGGNVDAHVAATARAYGSATALLGELRTLESELVAYVESLPGTFATHRALYGNLARQALEQPGHAELHRAQIDAAIGAASPVGAGAG